MKFVVLFLKIATLCLQLHTSRNISWNLLLLHVVKQKNKSARKLRKEYEFGKK